MADIPQRALSELEPIRMQDEVLRERTRTPPVKEPHGWLTMWPTPRGRQPIYTPGAEKPSYGPELDAKLPIIALYTAPPDLQQALADQREKIAAAWDGCMFGVPGEDIDIGVAIRHGKDFYEG